MQCSSAMHFFYYIYIVQLNNKTMKIEIMGASNLRLHHRNNNGKVKYDARQKMHFFSKFFFVN